MANYTFVNFAISSIAGGAGGTGSALGSGDTTLLLSTGDGSKFGAPSASAPLFILLGVVTGAHELCKVTNVATDTLTIVRAQEGTSASLWAVGTSVQAVVTAGIEAASIYNDGGLISTDGSGDITAVGLILTGGTLNFGPLVSGARSFLRQTSGLVQLAPPNAGSASGVIMASWDGAAAHNVTSFGGQFGAAPSYFDNLGNLVANSLDIIAGVTTAGKYGAPLMVGVTKDLNVVNSTGVTVLTVTMPNDGTNHMVRVYGDFYVGSGNTNAGTCTINVTYTDPHAGVTTNNFFTMGTTTALNASSVAKGTVIHPYARMFTASPNTSVTIAYQNSAAGTISDFVSAAIELLA